MGPALTRRTMMGSAFGLLLAGTAQAYGDPPLKQLAAEQGRYFGSAVRLDTIRRDAELKSALVRDCACLTPELALKWAAIERKRGELSLADMDDLADFARANAMKIHGHALIWGRSVPDWAEEVLTQPGGWGLVHKHFASVIPRYGDVIEQWDVVNEPIDTGHRMDGLRENAFLRAFGPDYIRRALEDARLFAPRARLMINEYGLDYDIPVEKDRRYLFLKLIENLRKSGAPLDGIGLQAHLDLGKGPFSEAVLDEFLMDLAGFGLIIIVSELDVKEYDYVLPVEERDRRVAEAVKRYLDVALAHRSVRGVSTWGLSDRYSWLEITPGDFARYAGAWKKGEGPGVNRGLPLDAAMRPKPLHAAIASALRAKPIEI